MTSQGGEAGSVSGARALLRTLVDAGVSVCFTNPGTSEMHFVAALDDVPQMRAVLTLFEGVATGAADGYGRMADSPAATLLHLGAGLGNGIANLHNARKAHTPIVNIVGDHATYHRHYETPLASDVETLARNVSTWVRTSRAPEDIGHDTAEAVAAAQDAPGRVATLVLPADVSWSDGAQRHAPQTPRPPRAPRAEVVDAVADLLGGEGTTLLLLGGTALRAQAQLDAARLHEATGARLVAEVFPRRMERGAGLPEIPRLPYFPDAARPTFDGVDHVVLVGCGEPVTFFAYPGEESRLVPPGVRLTTLAGLEDDAPAALRALVEKVGAADVDPPVVAPAGPDVPTGALDVASLCAVVGALLPERAIVSDEAQTSGFALPAATQGASRHDVLTLTGGAIGQGLPVAVGAAVAAPDRPVVALAGDGSSMYTIQALWTMARENLDVTAIICDNRSYLILNVELQRTGAATGAGTRAKQQLAIGDPDLDFVALAEGMGVPAKRAETAEDLATALRRAFAEPGPHLVQAVLG